MRHRPMPVPEMIQWVIALLEPEHAAKVDELIVQACVTSLVPMASGMADTALDVR